MALCSSSSRSRSASKARRRKKALARPVWLHVVRGVVFLVMLIVLAQHRRNKKGGGRVTAWDEDGKPLDSAAWRAHVATQAAGAVADEL
jgi:hypothetical protein|tara:strand:- start:226 stop:492 length:267 start_codon:yes stop_codon:yes gene_type:complete